jgi:hypothetical protein
MWAELRRENAEGLQAVSDRHDDVSGLLAWLLMSLSGRQIISRLVGSTEIFRLEERQSTVTSGPWSNNPIVESDRSIGYCQAPANEGRNSPAIKLMAEWLSFPNQTTRWFQIHHHQYRLLLHSFATIDWTLTVSFRSVLTVARWEISLGSHRRISATKFHVIILNFVE